MQSCTSASSGKSACVCHHTRRSTRKEHIRPPLPCQVGIAAGQSSHNSHLQGISRLSSDAFKTAGEGQMTVAIDQTHRRLRRDQARQRPATQNLLPNPADPTQRTAEPKAIKQQPRPGCSCQAVIQFLLQRQQHALPRPPIGPELTSGLLTFSLPTAQHLGDPMAISELAGAAERHNAIHGRRQNRQ